MRGNMTINSDDLLNSILASLDRIEHIESEDIPNIDLYMDQVTTFMDKKLKPSSRYPGEDKILTKTMINNYAKNNLLPPPVKKKYSKEHVLLLIFIYYYKGVLSINDIQTLLRPITEKYFKTGEDFNLESIYQEVFTMEKAEIETLKDDVARKYHTAQETFQNAPEETADFLKNFSFICALSYDVYVKKLIIEKIVDALAQKQAAADCPGKAESGKKKNNKGEKPEKENGGTEK